MRSVRFAAITLIAILAICITAQAKTIVVSPNSMNGWKIAIQKGTANTSPICNFVDGPGVAPSGSSSLHMQTFYSDSDPLSKVYIGTNDFMGVSLKEITSFKIWTFVSSRLYNRGQPPMVELITDSGTTTQQRRFVFYPWGRNGDQNVQFNTWQEWDLMSPTGYWELIYTSSPNYFGNWDWLINRYGNETSPMRIVVPPVGDYPTGNLTGTGLSVKIGAGKAVDSRYNAWWGESCGIDAYVDKLVIGVKGVETVFDFERLGPPPPVCGITNRGIYNSAAYQGSQRYRFMVWGIVQEDGFDNNQFFIDDGSGMPVKIYSPGHAAIPNCFFTVVGSLDPTQTPPTLNCDPFDMHMW